MTLYIAGPYPLIEGTQREIARQLHAAGYDTVLYPTAEAGIGWNNWLEFGVLSILNADGVALLPGITRGRGKLLLDLAYELGRPIHPPATWVQRAAARKRVPW
jgi:hypothetical protein